MRGTSPQTTFAGEFSGWLGRDGRGTAQVRNASVQACRASGTEKGEDVMGFAGVGGAGLTAEMAREGADREEAMAAGSIRVMAPGGSRDTPPPRLEPTGTMGTALMYCSSIRHRSRDLPTGLMPGPLVRAGGAEAGR